MRGATAARLQGVAAAAKARSRPRSAPNVRAEGVALHFSLTTLASSTNGVTTVSIIVIVITGDDHS